MKIQKKYVTIDQLSRGFRDTIFGGVVAYDGKLNVRPAYQREFVYDNKKREAVVQSIIKGYPIGNMYWGKSSDGKGWDLIDGQQRTISICQYVDNQYAITYNGSPCTFSNMITAYPEMAESILKYDLLVYECSGAAEERLNWFRTINLTGEKLTDQEILNAVYSGEWVTMCRDRFSKNGCPAKKGGFERYVRGNPIRQEILEQVYQWKANDEGLKKIEDYMAKHQDDKSVDELWNYYKDVMRWAQNLFPTYRKGITDAQAWGILYNTYKDEEYDPDELESEIAKLILDDDVRNVGIIEYVLSRGTKESVLNIRQFTDAMKQKKYAEQGGYCPICGKHYEYSEMEGDHIKPWCEGGHTTYDNLQMLCKDCNRHKSSK